MAGDTGNTDDGDNIAAPYKSPPADIHNNKGTDNRSRSHTHTDNHIRS